MVEIALDSVIPPIADPPTTKYVKHEKIQSELLTEFWGRPMHLGAHVLLPEGFDEHPEARYPLVINHGHFPHDFGGLPRGAARPRPRARVQRALRLAGYNRIEQEQAYQFYKDWTGPDFPRLLIIEIQHANPYYDDSYAVNSANLGPYGDAITYELIPYIEEKFRGIGEGWARFIYGGSTGGWEALAAQVFYPDEYNGCFAACPDPIDFRAYTVVNLYEDENAYYARQRVEADPAPGPPRLPRPRQRHPRGDEPPRAGARHEEPLRPAVGHLGGGLLPRRPRRLPEADLGQAHRRDRPRGGRALARELRPVPHPAARLGHARPEARGQDPHLRRRHGQLLPEQRRLPDGGVPRGARRTRTTAARSTTATAPSTAGTATTPAPTPSRGCATTRCSLPKIVERIAEDRAAGRRPDELEVLRRTPGGE